MHYDSNNEYISPWIQMLKSTFDSIGLSNIWGNEGDGFSSDYIVCAVKRRQEDLKMQDWYDNMYSMKSCTVYRMFISNLRFEEYIDKLCRKDSISLLKFRCRNSYIPVVKHTYTKVEEDKYCKLCNSGEVGDEIHFLCYCSSFNEERKVCFDNYRFRNVNVFTVNRIMNYRSVAKMKKPAKFVTQIMINFKYCNNKSNGKDFSEELHVNVTNTRCGRNVVRPVRLDL